jgi:hypothetical protein
MMFLRRHLRFAAVAWLLCQVASLSAFGPQNCCLAHRMTDGAAPECHRIDDGTCPMHAADGKACPAHASDDGDERPCVIRATCDRPAVALASLFSVNGILAEGTNVPFDATSSVLIVAARRPTPLLLSHDTPPPRL